MTDSAAATLARQDERESPASTRAADTLMTRLGICALIALAPATIVFLSFNQGGFFPNSTGLAVIALAAALVLRTTLAEHPFAGYNRHLAILLLALAFFALWQLASALWSHATARALDQYDRTLLYLLAFALFGSLPRTAGRIRWLIRALAAGMTAVCLAALISRVLPHVWPTASSFFASRLNYPLTYWNAEGLLAGLASILLIHIAATEREHPAARIVAATFVPATATTLLLTFSRGAIAVGILGLALYVVLARPQAIVGAAVSVVPTSAIAVRAAYAADQLATNTPTSAAAVAQGRHLASTVAICMVAAGVARAILLVPDSWLSNAISARPAVRRMSRALPPAAAVLAIAGVVVLSVSGFIGREYAKFAQDKQLVHRVTRERLTDISGENRAELWRLALQEFRHRPVIGDGAGTYALYYAQHKSTTDAVTDAHELYAQTLAELGIVGFVALVVVIGGALVGLAMRIRGSDRAAYAALFAAGVAWAVHAGVDWDWQMPAVTLWFFVTAAFALASSEPASQLGTGPRYRTPLAAGWLVLAIAPLLIGVSYGRLRASGQALAAGDCTKARQSAFSSISLLADRPEPYEILSFCDLQLGFPVEGLQAAQKAVQYDRNDWDYRYGLAIARAANGLDPRPAAMQALRMNPHEPILQEAASTFANERPRAWEQTAPALLVTALQSGRLSISNL